jgi:predicted flap endonuclease-1-like 5' DNA nuclease
MTRLIRQLVVFIISTFTSILVGWLLMDQLERQRQRESARVSSVPDEIPVPIPQKAERPAKPAVVVEVPPAKASEPAVEKAAPKTESKPASASEKDDLTVIEGIGPAYAKALNAIGIMTFADLAKQKPASLAQQMSARVTAERIRQENWIGQAKQLSKKA